MENLSIEARMYDGNCALISMRGFIDSTNASHFGEAIESCTQKHCFNVVVDFSAVEYVSSAGWGVLISKIRDIRERGGDILLAGMIEGIQSIYRLMELNQIFRAFENAEDALKIFTVAETTHERVVEKEAISSTVIPDEEMVSESTQTVRAQNLEDEIRAIIAENPLIGLRELPRELAREEHGGWKVGWFQLRTLLNEMELGTLVQRLYFAFLRAKGRI